jgi:hypothetical protein
MTIELLIQDNTEALRALHDLLQPALAALLTKTVAIKPEEKVVEEVKKASEIINEKVVEEVKEVVKKAPKKKEVKPEPVKVVEPEPEVEEDDPLADFEADVKVDEAAIEEVNPVLPAGKRDTAFYDANVKPVLAKLAKLDTQVLIDIVRTKYGVKKADMIDSALWDELVITVQAEIDDYSVV